MSREDDRPLVAMSMHMDRPVHRLLIEGMKARGWRILNLFHTSNIIPRDTLISGAFTHYPIHTEQTRLLLDLRCPVVRLGLLPHPEDHRLPALYPDIEAAGRVAATHFAERGFRHVGSIGFDPLKVHGPMHEAFAAEARAQGCTYHPLRMKESKTAKTREDHFDSRVHEVQDWLRGRPKPLGILAYNLRQAGRLAWLCQTQGIAVPEQVAILANEEHRVLAETASPPLSTIDPDAPAFAQTALDLLADRMAGTNALPCSIPIPPRGVTERQSTSVLAVEDAGVGRAIRFLWEHLAEPISVEDIARAAGVSRSRLERGFRRCLDRGVNAELRRKRLERFTHLLITTTETLPTLAAATGFQSLAYLHRLFREAHGRTPRAYRQEKAHQNTPQ